MFKNLSKILNEKNITNKSLAKMLNISEKTLWNKMNEESEFTLREATTIMELICPEYRMEYVFRSYSEDAA